MMNIIIDINELSSTLITFLSQNDLIKFRLNSRLKDLINNHVFLNKKVNTVYDITFKIVDILTKAYDKPEQYGTQSSYHGHLADGFSGLNTKFGFIIESYYGILISKIITPVGTIKPTGSTSHRSNDNRLNDYINSRITMIKIADSLSDEYGCYGPYYLITHIDGEVIEHPHIQKYSSINLMCDENIIRSFKYHFLKIQFDK